MAPHSSTLAWKIPWAEEPSGLQSMMSLRVGHDWVTSLSLFTFMHWRRKWQPTPVFLPGESQGSGWAAIYGVAQSRTRPSDFTLTFHFHALEKEMTTHSCSCLENPRDGGAWWAAVCGVAQSGTRLKRLSSSSSSLLLYSNSRLNPSFQWWDFYFSYGRTEHLRPGVGTSEFFIECKPLFQCF